MGAWVRGCVRGRVVGGVGGDAMGNELQRWGAGWLAHSSWRGCVRGRVVGGVGGDAMGNELPGNTPVLR